MAKIENKSTFVALGIMFAVAVIGIILVLFLNENYKNSLAEEPVEILEKQASESNDVPENPEKQKTAYESESTIDACVDSDSGKDYYVKGKAVWRGWQGDDFCEVYNTPGGWTQVDSCIAGDRSCSVAEKYCDSSAPNNIGQENKYCEYGCKDGDCLKEEIKCTDSDSGGNEYYVKGTIEGDGRVLGSMYAGTIRSATDFCLQLKKEPGYIFYPWEYDPTWNKDDILSNQNKYINCEKDCAIYEFYCGDNLTWAVAMQCPAGCKDGACIDADLG